MKKKAIRKAFLMLALFAVVVMSTFAFVACKKPTNYSITWELTNATVEVTNYNTAPSSVESGTEIKFSVVPTEGYKISSVKINGVTGTATEGKYSFTVTVDTTVVVLAEKELTSVVVKTNPTKMTYFAGESLDRAGMVVEASYATGEKENVDVNSTLLSVTPAVFEGGHESFTVSFGGKTSEAVSLTKVVENLVTIETRIAFNADNLALFSKYNNYSVSNKNTITFSYLDNLPKAGLALPVLEDTEDYAFMGYRTVNADGTLGGTITRINNDSRSLKIQVIWVAKLVEVQSMAFENRTVNEKTVSYLVIQGFFKLADDVSLYLFEGNDDVELDGTKVTGTKGDEFELLFDLKDLADADFVGKWMDIRFKATIDGNKEEMEIYASDPNVSVDLGATIQNPDGNGYYFMTHTAHGNTSLKVVHRPINYIYTAEFVEDGGTVKLNLDGTILDETLYGKTVCVSWDQDGAGKFPTYATIAADGKWNMSIDLKDLTAGGNRWAHISVLDGVDGDELMPREDLATAACTTSLPPINQVGEVARGIVFASSKGFIYHLGHMGWDANKLYIVDDRYAVTSIEVKEVEVDSKKEAHLVISGRYLANAEVTELLESLVLNLGHVEGDWARNEYDKNNLVLDADKGLFSYNINLSALEGLGNYFFHLGVGTGNESNLLLRGINGSIKVGDRIYTLVENYENWGAASAVMISDGAVEATSIELKEIDGKAYIVLEGTYTGSGNELLKNNEIFDLQVFDNGWAVHHFDDVITINNDGTFEIMVELTWLSLGRFVVHFNGDVYVQGAGSVISVDGRTYTLYDKTTLTWEGAPWGTACIGVSEDEMAVTNIELKEIDGKASMVVSGVYWLDAKDDEVIDSFVLDFQVFQGSWATTDITDGFELDVANGTFSYTIDLSGRDVATYMIHLRGSSFGNNLYIPGIEGSITVDGRTYTLVENISDWYISGVAITEAA